MFSSHPGSHSNELALEYFDFAYPLIFHRHWPSIRLALLSQPKPIALLNPFSLRHAEIKSQLLEQGAVDLLRFDNEQLQKEYATIQTQIAQNDNEYGVRKLLERQEKRRLLGTSDLTDEEEQPANDEDEDEDINTFNQPEPAQRLDQMYKEALDKQVRKTTDVCGG